MTNDEKSKKFCRMLGEYGDTLRKGRSPEYGSMSSGEKQALEMKLTDLRDGLQDMYDEALGL